MFDRSWYKYHHPATNLLDRPRLRSSQVALSASEIAVASVPGAWRPTCYAATVVRDLNQKSTHEAGHSGRLGN